MIERFKSLLEQLNLTPSEFADRIGVQRSSVSHVLSGRNKPSIDFLGKILNVFPDIDTTWLITGRATLLRTSREEDYNVKVDGIQVKSADVPPDNKKPPDPAEQEPVDHIILVYKNNTFRILKSSE